MAGQTTTSEAALNEAMYRLRRLHQPIEETHAALRDEGAVAASQAITLSAVVIKYGDAVQRAAVQVARDEGATWQHIGDLLGVTRSAAHQRFADSIT